MTAPPPKTPATPPQGAAFRLPLPKPDDREFLPAALEILETPPSPVRMALIVVMAALVVLALIWSYFGRLDVIAIAQGKIQPQGRTKIVQPSETGKVLRIARQNGDRVTKDEILVEFDPADARADKEAFGSAVSALRAEIARRDGVMGVVSPQSGVSTPTPPVIWPEGIPAATRERETQVMFADLSQLGATLNALEAQRLQKDRERQRLSETIVAQQVLVRTLNERVTMRSTLATSGFGSRASVLDSREILQKEETALATMKGQLAEAEAALDVTARERTRTLQVFLAEQTQKRADAQRTLDETAQRLAKANTRLENLTLRAPADGVVQSSTLYTLGQVVPAGQEVMRVVPEGGVMEVEAYLPNKDIGFVQEGQAVNVKIDSFPFTRFGMISGKVARVAYDAIAQAEATQIESNQRGNDGPLFGGGQRMQNLVFPIIITLDQRFIPVAGQPVPLTAGMTVTVEIKTGSRRILEYILSPVQEIASESLRER